MPGFDKVIQLLKVLGVEFQLNQTGADAPSVIAKSLGLPKYSDIPEVITKIEQLTIEAAKSEEIIQEIRTVRDAVLLQAPTPTRQVEVRELAAAAGGGAMDLDETVTGYVAFRRDWLDRTVADPTRCNRHLRHGRFYGANVAGRL